MTQTVGAGIDRVRSVGAGRRGVLGGSVAAAALLLAWIHTPNAQAAAPAPMLQLPAPRSLLLELQQALQKGEPLVLMISLEACPFCKVAREHYLAPMRRDEGLPVVQIDMQSRAVVLDWQGKPTTHVELIERLGVNVAPTLVFYGRKGQEVAERLVGVSSVDFYGAYLNQRLLLARKAVRT
jgi:thiol:disulfide interchange protein